MGPEQGPPRVPEQPLGEEGAPGLSAAPVLRRGPFSPADRAVYRALSFLARFTLVPYFRLRATDADRVPDGAFLLAANHASYLDPIVLQLALPRRRLVYLMTADWYRRPLLRPFFRAMRAIPVRENVHSNRDALERALAALRAGVPVGIFPEGRVSLDGRLQTFHPGVAKLASRAGVPIVPAGIVGTFEALPKGRLWPRPRPVSVRFGAPLFVRREDEIPKPQRRREHRAATQAVRAAVSELLSASVDAADGRRSN